jgi:MFS family permease
MFVVWLIGLALAVAAPVVLVLAVRRVLDPVTRRGGWRVLLGGLIGAAVGFFLSTVIEFVAERRVDALNDYWWAAVAAGFTVGAIVGLLVHGGQTAGERIAEAVEEFEAEHAARRGPDDAPRVGRDASPRLPARSTDRPAE